MSALDGDRLTSIVADKAVLLNPVECHQRIELSQNIWGTVIGRRVEAKPASAVSGWISRREELVDA